MNIELTFGLLLSVLSLHALIYFAYTYVIFKELNVHSLMLLTMDQCHVLMRISLIRPARTNVKTDIHLLELLK